MPSVYNDDLVCCMSFGQVYELEGVVQLHDAHFWTLCSGNFHGSLRLDMMQGSDIRRSLELAKTILTEVQIVLCIYIYMYTGSSLSFLL